MRRYRLLVLFLCAVCVAGCLPSGPVSQTDGVHGAANYTVRIWANTDCPAPNQTVTLRARVTNDGPQTEIAKTDDQPVLDILVSPLRTGGDDRPGTLRWSDGKSLTADLTRLELKPGESRSIEFQIPFPGGDYSASARFTYDTAHSDGSIEPAVYLRQFCGNY